MTRIDILAAAPVAPLCFLDRSGWVEYLRSAQDDKVPASRPFDGGGRWNVGFDHCRDCTPCHRRTMCAAGRCRPPLNARAEAFRAARLAGKSVRSMRAKAAAGRGRTG